MSPSLPPEVVRAFIDRKAILWVCQKYDLNSGEQPHDYDLPTPQTIARYRKFPDKIDNQIAQLYWEAIWLEGAASPLLQTFRASSAQGKENRPVVLLASASDTQARVPVEEFLPIRVLPGVIDANAPLDAQYGVTKGRVRERTAWDLASQLDQYRGRTLVVLGAVGESDLARLFEVLEDTPALDLDVLIVGPGPTATGNQPMLAGVRVVWLNGETAELLKAISDAGAPSSRELPTWAIRLGKKTLALSGKDVRHILTKFAIITERDTIPPTSFALDDLQQFLEGDLSNWKAFGVALPVERGYQSSAGRSFALEVEQTLRQMEGKDSETSTFVLQLPAQGGSGATTLLRAAAYQSARSGYPTLVLRPDEVDIDLDHILAFSDVITDGALTLGLDEVPPLVVVTDVEHSSIPSIKQISQLLASRNRKVLLIQGIQIDWEDSLQEKRTKRFARLAPLKSHVEAGEISRCEAAFQSLAKRWDLPIEAKTEDQWSAYESATRWYDPGSQKQISSLFWVALRFFVVEAFDIDQRQRAEDAVGRWIQKRTDKVTDAGMKKLLDYVAVLSSFRIVSPMWTVLRPITGGAFSSLIVDALRQTRDIVVWGDSVEELGDQTLRFLHPALADEYLRRRGIRDIADKINLLSPVIASLSGGHQGDIWVAESFVIDVLVPDYLGRRQFDWDWRLDFFRQIPPFIRDQSKLILHHWARCLYQSTDSPKLTEDQKRERFDGAIEKLKVAIKLPRRPARDEHPSHLYNTLGTAYARYARLLEGIRGQEDNARNSWKEASSAFQQAINVGGGTNLEALLGFSLRLIDHAEHQAGSRLAPEHADDVAYALDLIDEAELLLTDAASPDPELEENVVKYRARALNWLQVGAGLDYLRRLQQTDSSDLGFYCEAQLTLGGTPSDSASIENALSVLEKAEARGVQLSPRSLRLRLSLLRRHPGERFNFASQKEILQALETRLGYQPRPLELFYHAVLCYQLEVFVEGAERFRKLRDKTARSGNTPPRVREVWRDRKDPTRARVTHIKVTRVMGDWRGEAFAPEMGQRMPVRPRQFSPALKMNDVSECIVRFEFSGPLAIPRRLEEISERGSKRVR
ncbi:MAG: hypothetical protein LAO20_21860 [Acidobacteriia bacterium]|nr:hypothetical protein [Terriglobia bacterium]